MCACVCACNVNIQIVKDETFTNSDVWKHSYYCRVVCHDNFAVLFRDQP